MNKFKCRPYAPHERGFFDQKPQRIRAYSESDYTELPDPVRDPIATNNIVNQEFDYTYNGGEALNLDDCQDYNIETKSKTIKKE